jgi:hypothetical protein
MKFNEFYANNFRAKRNVGDGDRQWHLRPPCELTWTIVVS